MNRKTKKRIIITMSCLCLVTGLVCLGFVAYKEIDPLIKASEIVELADDVSGDNLADDVTNATNEVADDDTVRPVELVNGERLRQKAPAAIAWLKLAGTNIKHPVAIPPTGNDNYYLTHDVYGNYSESGTLFLDPLCSLSSTAKIVYGHKMNARTMFHDIGNKADQWAFDQLGVLDWWDRDGGTKHLIPVAAQRVNANETDLRNVPKMDEKELMAWELSFYKQASAKADSSVVSKLDGKRHAVFLVTCSGYVAYGHGTRTVVMFVEM